MSIYSDWKKASFEVKNTAFLTTGAVVGTIAVGVGAWAAMHLAIPGSEGREMLNSLPAASAILCGGAGIFLGSIPGAAAGHALQVTLYNRAKAPTP